MVFYTTPTSATASIWRILQVLSEGQYELNRITDKYYMLGGISQLKSAEIPRYNQLVLFNTPQFLNGNLDLRNYRWILNVRDFRDLGCNQYHWKLQHPEPTKADEKLESERDLIREIGIDDFCMQRDFQKLYLNHFRKITESGAQFSFATYALLCLEFDKFVEVCANALQVKVTHEHLKKLELERIDNLKRNSNWIGNQWEGSDIMPGRFKKELSPVTIEQLNRRYRETLEFLTQHDHPLVTHTYRDN